MKDELSRFIYNTYQEYLKSEHTNGIPFGDYLAEALLNKYTVENKGEVRLRKSELYHSNGLPL
jgi:hypothetical protein